MANNEIDNYPSTAPKPIKMTNQLFLALDSKRKSALHVTEPVSVSSEIAIDTNAVKFIDMILDK